MSINPSGSYGASTYGRGAYSGGDAPPITGAGWPTLADVRTWLQMQPATDTDAVIESCRLAAIDYAVTKTGNQWTLTSAVVPLEVAQAARMDAAHLYRRRDSLDGTISWGEMGALRVGRYDPDVERAYDHYAPMVFG